MGLYLFLIVSLTFFVFLIPSIAGVSFASAALLAGLVFFITVLAKSVKIVPQAEAFVVERLGKYQRTLGPGLNLLLPVLEKTRSRLDLREQVVSFPPQPVITQDNLVVDVDTVIYFQVVDPRAATYEIADYIPAIEQLTVTTLRNVIGGLDLERTLTSREEINKQLRGVLDETTSPWGIRIARVEIKSIDPPATVREAMEKQLKAERERRAAILTAEGEKQSKILIAEGERQASILRAEGERQAEILRAEGEASAVKTVFESVSKASPDSATLTYLYLQALPKLAEKPGDKVWVIPAELSRVVSQFAPVFDNSTKKEER
jgi:regulator of protease activity HflC (stomatin/prohibitin superfamily)